MTTFNEAIEGHFKSHMPKDYADMAIFVFREAVQNCNELAESPAPLSEEAPTPISASDFYKTYSKVVYNFIDTLEFADTYAKYYSGLANTKSAAFSEEAARREFEEWAKDREEFKHFPQRFARLKEDADKYLFGYVQVAYESWLACAKKRAEG